MPKLRKSAAKSVHFKPGPPDVSVIPWGMETWENCREPLQEPSPKDLSFAKQLAAKSLAEAEALQRADTKKARDAPYAKSPARPVKDTYIQQRSRDSRVPRREPVLPPGPLFPQYSSSAPNSPYVPRTHRPSAARPHQASRPPTTRAATDVKKASSSDPFTFWEQAPRRDYGNKQSASPEDLRKKALESAVGFGKVAMERFQQMRGDPVWRNSFNTFKKKR